MATVYLALGSNLGDREARLAEATKKIEERVGMVSARSSLYQTKPWGYRSPHDYINACLEVETDLEPLPLLLATQAIEREMGRTHKTVDGQYQDRVIDIDILLYDQLRLETPQLVIPHPLMAERDFVIKPLSEICPQWRELLSRASLSRPLA